MASPTTAARPAPLEHATGRTRSFSLAGWAQWVVIGAGLVVGFYLAAAHVPIGNSDGATVILEGKAVAQGNLLLRGWALSLDSFWTVDVPFYAAAVMFAGVRPSLLYAVPAVIASLSVVTAALVARDGRSGLAAWAGSGTVLALVGMPSPYLANFLVQGPLHVGTTLWCLLAFVALRKERPGIGLVLGVALLAAGMLGDLLTVALGILPVVLASAVMARRYGRSSLLPAAAAMAAVAVAALARMLASAAGTFTISPANPVAYSPVRMAENLYFAALRSVELLGAHGAGGLDAGPLWLDAARLAGILVFFGAVATGVLAIIRDLRHPRPVARGAGPRLVARGAGPRGLTREREMMDAFLLFGTAGSAGVFVLLSLSSAASYGHYLTAAMIFGSALAGRNVARIASHLRLGGRPAPGVVAVLVAACVCVYGVGFAGEVVAPPPFNDGIALASFLGSHGLHQGIGGYWSASLLTVDSGGRVEVRPVIDVRNRLVRYGRQSPSSWYRGHRFQFLLYDSAVPWGNVNRRTAVAAFGPVARQYHFGSWVILTWPKPVTISPAIVPGSSV
ncbi:MAG: hypothetical protein ACYDH5_09380 [Acidimicrobiales bacterium]